MAVLMCQILKGLLQYYQLVMQMDYTENSVIETAPFL